jgi:hypothetical protein
MLNMRIRWVVSSSVGPKAIVDFYSNIGSNFPRFYASSFALQKIFSLYKFSLFIGCAISASDRSSP